MDNIVDALEDLHHASESMEVKAGVEDLKELSDDLVECAKGCAEDFKSVVDNFREWKDQVSKINLAYMTELEVQGTTICHIPSHFNS